MLRLNFVLNLTFLMTLTHKKLFSMYRTSLHSMPAPLTHLTPFHVFIHPHTTPLLDTARKSTTYHTSSFVRLLSPFAEVTKAHEDR